jgi:putative glutamine amidotransferase
MNESSLIAITTGGEEHFPRHPELYLQAVKAVRASAIFIMPDVSIIDSVMRYAGFLIPGGGDIDPMFYNEESIGTLPLEDQKRVRFDLSVIDCAMKQGKPVLGICYGMQIINVALGGTLYQDIGTQVSKTIDHREGTHSIQVNDNPFLTAGQYEANSSHHQAVKALGRGLVACAYSPDKMIEAFYSSQYRFLMGVQWHPERMQNAISEAVFRSFIGACLERK